MDRQSQAWAAGWLQGCPIHLTFHHIPRPGSQDLPPGTRNPVVHGLEGLEPLGLVEGGRPEEGQEEGSEVPPTEH